MPGWSWDDEIKPYSDGLEACPMYHREYVDVGPDALPDGSDGTEVIAQPGQFLFIEPGHRAWVEGNETAVPHRLVAPARLLEERLALREVRATDLFIQFHAEPGRVGQHDLAVRRTVRAPVAPHRRAAHSRSATASR